MAPPHLQWHLLLRLLLRMHRHLLLQLPLFCPLHRPPSCPLCRLLLWPHLCVRFLPGEREGVGGQPLLQRLRHLLQQLVVVVVVVVVLLLLS